MEHTKGPWRTDSLGGRVLSEKPPDFRGTDYVVAQTSTYCSPDWEQSKANARLIAAAPDLPAALDAICKIAGSAPGAPDTRLAECRRIARAARAKGTA